MLSVIIPLYRSEPNLDRLLTEVPKLAEHEPLEVVFVVDGSPDRCEQILLERLPRMALRSQLVSLSRNFGSFAAIAAGLSVAKGDQFAVLAADLQEPPELVLEFSRILRAGEADVVFGVRASRSDPWLSEVAAGMFWAVYRRLVIPDLPPGGVDIFGCTRMVRDRLLELPEARTNLIALLFWLGFRRKFVPYHRQPRREGVSAWTFAKKLRYSINSIFDFTDLPVQFLMWSGLVGTALAILGGAVVVWAKLRGEIDVPGYTPIVLAVMFFGGVTTFGLGVLGQYLWLTLANSRRRPNFLIRNSWEFQ